MTGQGDAWSPGWFDIPLQAGDCATLVLSADPKPPTDEELTSFIADRQKRNNHALDRASFDTNDTLGRQLAIAAQAFVVRRDDTRTVIAGYPWFLDWGRDSLIAARGLIAAGMLPEVRDLLVTFARFEKDGTLPNSIHGEDASNRDTSDAPLWFGIVCEELAAQTQPGDANLYAQRDPRRPPLHCLWLHRGDRERDPRRPRLVTRLEPLPFHLDGHQPSGRHSPGRLPR
jgi:predicted glycogen debranching enzyme